MSSHKISIRPFGVHAILVEWPVVVEEAILNEILEFVQYLKKYQLKETDWEFIPAYNSLTMICKDTEIDFDILKPKIKEWYLAKKEPVVLDQYLWRLPVCYDVEYGVDLEEVANHLGVSIQEVIRLHSSAIYTVYGIGFLPGFTYLGGLPEALEVARKAVPNPKVFKGSVGIAGKQTGIYPQDSPGGWNIIGICSVPMFDAKSDTPCFVKVGDKVQFYPISKAEYQLHKIESEVGIYKMEKIKWDA